MKALTVFRIALAIVGLGALAWSLLQALGRSPLPAPIPGWYLLILATLCLGLAYSLPRFPLLAESDWELRLFRVGMWGIAACSFAAIFSKAIWRRPTSASVFNLLILAGASLLLAVLVPKLEIYLLSKLRKISLGGIELELSANVVTAAEWLKYDEVPPSELESTTPDPPADRPFAERQLTGPQRYQYERLSHRLYLLFCQVSDLNGLDSRTRHNCRQLIKYVGRAAITMKHFAKALDILSHLRDFADRELDHRELYLLASAHLWAADELPLESEKKASWQEAVLLLEKAGKENAHEVRIPYNLGWAFLSLGRHEKGIECMNASLQIDPSVAPWARWNIACGHKKLGREREALAALESIPPGRWWKSIRDDSWFAEDPSTPFSQSFRQLWLSKIAEYEAGNP